MAIACTNSVTGPPQQLHLIWIAAFAASNQSDTIASELVESSHSDRQSVDGFRERDFKEVDKGADDTCRNDRTDATDATDATEETDGADDATEATEATDGRDGTDGTNGTDDADSARGAEYCDSGATATAFMHIHK